MKNENWMKYFDEMGDAQRAAVEAWFGNQVPATQEQKCFLWRVERALDIIRYPYRIANMEPSMDENGKIYYELCNPVVINLTGHEWERKAMEFSPEHASELASIYELFLWYAYRIACGYWTMEYVCDNSLGAGNYFDAPAASGKLEASGARVVGGAMDGVGNTYKIIKRNGNIGLCGGCFKNSGKKYFVAEFSHNHFPKSCISYGAGVIVLKK